MTTPCLAHVEIVNEGKPALIRPRAVHLAGTADLAGWCPVQNDVLVVGAAIVDALDRPTRLLSARRTQPPRLAGGWELPGGKVEPGEGAVAALHRELAEELGVTVRLGAEVLPSGGGAWPLPPSARLRVWLAEVTEGEPAPLEDHDLLRWLPLEHALDVAWLGADVPVVRAVLGLVDSRT
jgi:8-oxo-dGTP diphosphatase